MRLQLHYKKLATRAALLVGVLVLFFATASVCYGWASAAFANRGNTITTGSYAFRAAALQDGSTFDLTPNTVEDGALVTSYTGTLTGQTEGATQTVIVAISNTDANGIDFQVKFSATGTDVSETTFAVSQLTTTPDGFTGVRATMQGSGDDGALVLMPVAASVQNVSFIQLTNTDDGDAADGEEGDIAQATPTPEPTEEDEVTPSATPTEEDEATPTATPTDADEEGEEDEVEATPTPTPTTTPTPTATPEPVTNGFTWSTAPTIDSGAFQVPAGTTIYLQITYTGTTNATLSILTTYANTVSTAW